jgi:hypothetical protein
MRFCNVSTFSPLKTPEKSESLRIDTAEHVDVGTRLDRQDGPQTPQKKVEN